VAGQYGLNGFLMLLPQTTETGAAGCCRRLEALLQSASGGNGPRPPLHACFGIAGFSPDTSTPQSLLRRAEESLAQARGGSAGNS
jgi:GGDEF domain-containing protein